MAQPLQIDESERNQKDSSHKEPFHLESSFSHLVLSDNLEVQGYRVVRIFVGAAGVKGAITYHFAGFGTIKVQAAVRLGYSSFGTHASP